MGSLPRWLQWLGLAQAEARSQELHPILPRGGRAQGTRVLCPCFPVHIYKEAEPVPTGDVSVQAASLQAVLLQCISHVPGGEGVPQATGLQSTCSFRWASVVAVWSSLLSLWEAGIRALVDGPRCWPHCPTRRLKQRWVNQTACCPRPLPHGV